MLWLYIELFVCVFWLYFMYVCVFWLYGNFFMCIYGKVVNFSVYDTCFVNKKECQLSVLMYLIIWLHTLLTRTNGFVYNA